MTLAVIAVLGTLGLGLVVFRVFAGGMIGATAAVALKLHKQACEADVETHLTFTRASTRLRLEHDAQTRARS